MKMQCEIIRDLIPLMEDDVCSEQSKMAVLKHIEECEECKQIYENATNNLHFVLDADELATTEVLHKGFKKVKRRWCASILIILFMLPILYLCWGQYYGRGISFTNINEFVIARAFLSDLEKDDYEAAFQHLHLEPMKQRWLQDWFEEEKLENIETDAKRVFCDSAMLLKKNGGIENPKLLAINAQANHYTIYYTIMVNDQEKEFFMDVTDKGIINFSGYGSFIDDPVAHFGAWSEFLWQEYKECYFDAETKQYIPLLP